MKDKRIAHSEPALPASRQQTVRKRDAFSIRYSLSSSRGFTLIETMVAIALLMVALIPPMSLAAQSLTTAYFARDQITAFYLAQEGVEIVRSVRDANIIALAKGQTITDVFCTPSNCIPYGTTASNAPVFTVDALQTTSNALDTCAQIGSGQYQCPYLQTNGSVYGYSPGCEPNGSNATWSVTDCGTLDGWTDTTFTRTVKAYLLNATDPDEMRVSVTVTWSEGSLNQSFTINEDLYRWVNG